MALAIGVEYASVFIAQAFDGLQQARQVVRFIPSDDADAQPIHLDCMRFARAYLTRAGLLGGNLGKLRSWASFWFAGFPSGDHVILIRQRPERK